MSDGEKDRGRDRHRGGRDREKRRGENERHTKITTHAGTETKTLLFFMNMSLIGVYGLVKAEYCVR